MKEIHSVLCCFLITSSLAAASSDRPNIIVIMADDMGYSDLGCYGGEIETPNLDALAAGGLRFSQFYNTARCCPTRASLLTGLYAHQANIGHMVDGAGPRSGLSSYAGELSDHAVTIAEVLQSAGYSTYMAGKWHVTAVTRPQSDAEKHNWPLQRGFERFYGTIHGAGSFFDPNTLTRDNAFVSPYADHEYRPDEYYYTDAISDHAVRFVSEHAGQGASKPFFLYIAHTAAHWPMHVKDRDIAKYKGRYDSGYTPIRAARLQKLKHLKLLDERWRVTPQAGDWEKVENKEWEARCMEVYAAMVDCMDQGIGRLVEALKKNGQYHNTLILFLQDNGGCAEGMGRSGPYTARAETPTLPTLTKEYLQPDMIPKQTREGFPVRQGAGVMPGGADTYVGYGRDWANVSNTPFREYKHFEHEGGISTPLIAHWPAVMQGGGLRSTLPGGLVSTPAHLIDLMATCVELAGAQYPKQHRGKPVIPMEGVSLVPALSGKTFSRANPLFWEHEGNRAVRVGEWKLVSKHSGAWELYNMSSDRTEMNNVALQHPGRLVEMEAQWNEWAARVGVVPWPLGAGTPRKNAAKTNGR